MTTAENRDLPIALNGPQFEAYQAIANRRTVFCGWGRGVGKSFFLRTVWWLLVAQYRNKVRTTALKPFRGVRIIVLMPTLLQFKDVHLAGIEEDLGPGGDWAWLGAKIDRNRGHVHFRDGSWLKAFPSQQHTSRHARGMRGDVLCADEVDDTDGHVYDSVAVPWLSEPWSLGIELDAGTPTRGRHGLWYRLLQAGRDADRYRNGQMSRDEVLSMESTQSVIEVARQIKGPERPKDPEQFAIDRFANHYSFHATYRDAPETVSPLAVANARLNSSDSTFKREWEADPDAGEGFIYVGFDNNFHVRPHPPLNVFREIHVGVDWGMAHAGAMLMIGVFGDGDRETAWLIAEEYGSGIQNTEWNVVAKRWEGCDRFWCDPSRNDRIDELKQLGITAEGADNNVVGGISQVANLLHIRQTEAGEKYARLYVDPGCENTIREFGLYKRKTNRDGTFQEAPQKKNDDAMDALRYAIVGIFGRHGSTRHTTAGR